jgi:hypothetical protein
MPFVLGFCVRLFVCAQQPTPGLIDDPNRLLDRVSERRIHECMLEELCCYLLSRIGCK